MSSEVNYQERQAAHKRVSLSLSPLLSLHLSPSLSLSFSLHLSLLCSFSNLFLFSFGPFLSPSVRCPAFRRMREEAERRKRPPWNEIKASKAEAEDGKSTPTLSRASPRVPAEPGLVNPAFEEGEEGKSSRPAPRK